MDGRARRGDVAWPWEMLQLNEPSGLLPLLNTSHGILEWFDLEGWVGRGLKGHFFTGRAVQPGAVVESPWRDLKDVQKWSLGTWVDEMTDPDDLRGLLQLKQLRDFMNPIKQFGSYTESAEPLFISRQLIPCSHQPVPAGIDLRPVPCQAVTLPCSQRVLTLRNPCGNRELPVPESCRQPRRAPPGPA